jgi:hypothetical protein
MLGSGNVLARRDAIFRLQNWIDLLTGEQPDAAIVKDRRPESLVEEKPGSGRFWIVKAAHGARDVAALLHFLVQGFVAATR